MARPLDYSRWNKLEDYDSGDDDGDDDGAGGAGAAGGHGHAHGHGRAKAVPRKGREPLIIITVPWDTFGGTDRVKRRVKRREGA